MSDPGQPEAPPPEGGRNPSGKPPRTSRRPLALGIVGAVIVIGGIAYGLHWFLVSRHEVTTDDAYVGGDIVQVTAQVPGTVIEVAVDDTGIVAAGDRLVRIDPADYRIAVERAETTLAAAVRQARQQFTAVERVRATVTADETALARASADLSRRRGASAPAAISEEDLQHARDAEQSARASLAAARADLASAQAAVSGTTVETSVAVRQAAAQLRQALLDQRRAEITAPIAGVIAKRAVHVGQRVEPGQPLMAVVPIAAAWVDANFKETSLRELRPGMQVELHADVYGGKATYHGHIIGLGAGTGSAFAALPVQNASGNWIKVVQRLPVRIGLDPRELRDHPLRVGLSMSVKIRLSAPEGIPDGATGRSMARSIPSAADDAASDRRIAEIIRANLEEAPAATASTAASR